MKIINLTPHPIICFSQGGKIEIPPSGKIARIKEEVIKREKMIINEKEVVEVIVKEQKEIENLPPQQEGIYYFVSLPVAQMVRREDLLVPGEVVRDEKGFTKGIKSFAKII